MSEYFDDAVRPNAQAFIDCLTRQGGTPQRVHHCELFLDDEMKEAVAARFGVWDNIAADTPFADLEREQALQRFMGYDYVRGCLEKVDHHFNRVEAEDTADLRRSGGRAYQDEHSGPISDKASFDAYIWPDPDVLGVTRQLEWYEKYLAADMCIVAQGGFGHFCEHLSWLFGYEPLCYALFDNRNLVAAVSEKLLDISKRALEHVLSFDCVKAVWASDDMGFRSGTLIGPNDLREFVLPAHKALAEMAHDAGRPYLLHSCGKLDAIMPDLLEDVGHRCTAFL